MPLERANFDDISERDLLDLIEAGVPEGVAIDYKREPYGNSDAQKREALKDITSFANSAGGHLVIGMAEREGLPNGLTGLPGVDLDKLKTRLESLVRDGVEPRIIGIRMGQVAVNGGWAFVVRVPRSWNPPHRVSAGGWNKFFVRNSGGAHEASVEELRSLFTLTADARERMRNFRDERIVKVVAGRGPVNITAGGRLFVHIMPLSAFTQPGQIDLEQALQVGGLFTPIGASGRTDKFNFDGFINLRGGSVCHGYTQVFHAGIVEATKAEIRGEFEGQKIVHWSEIVKTVEAVPTYVEGLRQLGVSPPLVIAISLQGVMGSKLGLKGYDYDLDEITALPADDPLLLPEIVIDDYGHSFDVINALRPALDSLWNGAGFSGCTYYDGNGNWTPPR